MSFEPKLEKVTNIINKFDLLHYLYFEKITIYIYYMYVHLSDRHLIYFNEIQIFIS